MSVRSPDVARFAWRALQGYPARTLLMLLAMGIGVAAVVVLTALGEGARRYVVEEFSSLGTNLLIVIPGRSETGGFQPGSLMGETPRDLTLTDALALTRSSNVRRVAPLVIGQVEISWGGRARDVVIIGSSHEYQAVRHLDMGQGHFLPAEDWDRAEPVAVIGTRIRRELFGAGRALGQWLRIGDRRYRIIGILATSAHSLGINFDDVVIIPVASALQLFNRSSLFRILVEARSREAIEPVRRFIRDTLKRRHQGVEDVTIVTQDAVLSTFDKILAALTYAVGGIAAISLGVAGILIMNVMLIAVSQRTAEIGLLKALGASRRAITILILTEAVLLASAGALGGLLLGLLGNHILRQVLPALPAQTPLWALLSAMGVAIATGLIFSLMPARRAARLDPVLALSRH